MGQLPAQARLWPSTGSRFPGAKPASPRDIDARLDKAIADKRIGNLHSVVIVRHGRVVFERYFEGEDTARGSRPMGVVSFKTDCCTICVRYEEHRRLAVRDRAGAGKVPAPEAPLMASFPEYADLAADPARNRWTCISAVDDDGYRLE